MLIIVGTLVTLLSVFGGYALAGGHLGALIQPVEILMIAGAGVGAFILGFVTTRLLERLPLSAYRRPLLGTGLCGGLTTFSTMQVETVQMIERQHYGMAAGYTVVSVVAGFLAVYVATALARRVSLR